MVSLLNRFGHCASDETIRKIKLGLEETLYETKTLVPSHIIRKSGFSTGPARVNFDINIETPSGANTIRHTYEICYQNTLPQEEIQTSEKLQKKKILLHQENTPCRRP